MHGFGITETLRQLSDEILDVDEGSMYPALYRMQRRGWIEAEPEKMYGPVRERFRGGAQVMAVDYVAAWQALDRFRADYAQATAAFDAVILPTAPILPPNMEAIATDPEFFAAENLMTLRNTRIGNLMGLAGLTLPTGIPSCGILFQGPSDEQLLRIGAAAEQALA